MAVVTRMYHIYRFNSNKDILAAMFAVIGHFRILPRWNAFKWTINVFSRLFSSYSSKF